MPPRRPSLADLARTLNLAASTVSRALASSPEVSEATRQRVRRLADELRYQPNPAAVALRRGYGTTLGVLLPRITGSFFPEVVAGILAVAGPAGYHALLCLSHEDTQQECRHLERLLKAKVAGVLVSPAGSSPDQAHLAAARAADLPLVLLGQPAAGEGLAGRRVGTVAVDDYAGAYAAVAHLLAEGCRRVAHLSGPAHLDHYQRRHQGYRQALHDYGLPYRDELCRATEPTQPAGAAALRQLLPLKPDAVFASTDTLAAGALHVLKERGLRVPHDVAVAGFGNASFAALTEPPLTTVNPRSHELGGQAARQLLHLLRPGAAPVAPVVLAPQLLVRASSTRRELAAGEASLLPCPDSL